MRCTSSVYYTARRLTRCDRHGRHGHRPCRPKVDRTRQRPLTRLGEGGAVLRAGGQWPPVRPVPPLFLFWKSAIIFLIFSWFCGLRASCSTFAATPDAISFRSMPAMFASSLWTAYSVPQGQACQPPRPRSRPMGSGDLVHGVHLDGEPAACACLGGWEPHFS